MKAALVLLLFAAYPPSYRWQTITTDHFYIHFHQGEERLAPRVAVLAEDIHARLAPMMQWTPHERTHVILTDHIDAANGSATPFPFNRIEIYVSAPGADPSSPIEYYDNWLNLVLTHEYTHILHLDQARAVPGIVRRIFGRMPIAFPNAWSPLWMTEGVATLVESEATDTGRLKGTFVDMVLRTAAVEDRWFSEAQASGLTATWPGGSARYFYGSKFLSWLKDHEGMEKVAQYFNNYSGNFIPFNVNGPARAVFGRNMSALYRDWSTEQQRIYREEVDHVRDAGLTARRRVTTLGFETKHSRVSPDGKAVAFAHTGAYEWPSIRVIDVATGQEIARRNVNSPSPLSWSTDGERLAYSQLEFVRSFSLLSDLYVWNVRANSARQITRGARLKDPSFTPDGKTIIAVENRAGQNSIVEVDVASGTIRPLVSPRDLIQFSEPNVSHDGNSIAVAEWNNGRIDIVLYDRSGRRLRNLTESLQRSTNASPHFSADDRTVYFSSDVTGVSNIYAAEVGGAPLKRLTNVYGGAFFPSTADNRTIYYTDYSSAGFDIASFDVGKTYDITPRRLSGPLPAAAAKAFTPSAAHAYSPWQSLRPRWWLPQVNDDGKLGIITNGADALGFHSYSFDFAGSDYTVAYANNRYYPTLTFIAAEYDDRPGFAVRTGGNLVAYRERTRRFLADATFPLIRYRHQTFAGVSVIRDRVTPDIGAPVTNPIIFTGTLQGIRTSFTFNNAYELGYAISPENGIRAIASIENLSRSLGSDRSVRTVFLDLRGYRGIPITRSPAGRHALALRVAGGRATGDFVLQRDLRVGGAGSGEFVTVDTTNLPVRGFPSGELRGRDAAVASLEYRFPIYEIERGPSTWPLFFHRIIGDVFADAGSAWDRQPNALRPRTSAFESGNTIASVGAEAGLDLVLGFFSGLRYRVGAAYLVKGGTGFKWYTALSTSF